MILSQRAQSVLEYLIIATIIMAGIVIGGPFLAKAVGAHFRLLEDSTVDSIGEDIRQAPLPPLPNPNCTCDKDWHKGGCGNDDPCNSSQRVYTRGCNPDGCNTMLECRSAPDCCKDPVIEHCGTILPDPPVVGSCAGPRPLPKATLSDGSQVDVFDPPGSYKGVCPGGNNCLIWERLYSITCGAGTSGNPSATVKYYACKDVHGETVGGKLADCGPQCWDASSNDSSAFSGSSECDPGAETNPQYLPDELNMRFNGFIYNGTTYTDLPPPGRGVGYQPNFPVLEMFDAYEVINTYFDPKVDLYNPYADQCAPGQANYGTAACHRCDPNRRCEFICPTGYAPMSVDMPSVGTVPNGTCKPCDNGIVQVTVYKYTTTDYDTLLYTSPHMSSVVSYHTLINDAQNFIGGGINSNDGHCEYFSNHGNNKMGTCYAAVRTQFSVAGNPGIYCANWGNFNTGSRFNADYTPPGTFTGHNYALVILRRNEHDYPISTMKAHIYWTNPDFKICTENKLHVTFSSTSSTNEATLYADGGGSPGAYIGYSRGGFPTDDILVPQETIGFSYLYIDCPSGCTISSPGVCFQDESLGACSTSFTGTHKLKLTYPAS